MTAHTFTVRLANGDRVDFNHCAACREMGPVDVDTGWCRACWRLALFTGALARPVTYPEPFRSPTPTTLTPPVSVRIFDGRVAMDVEVPTAPPRKPRP
jgi:hypothetical protein